MRYEDFRNAIRTELRRTPTGLTWPQLQARLALPYARPCPTWVKRLEQEIGLTRTKGPPPPNSRTAKQNGDRTRPRVPFSAPSRKTRASRNHPHFQNLGVRFVSGCHSRVKPRLLRPHQDASLPS